VKLRKIILPILLGLAGYYAVFGGEYSLLELRQARREIRQKEEELTRLRAEVEYLRAWADSLEHDSATIERIAREEHGMIREGEILFWTQEPEDTASDTIY
jgi:cell division protein FtsB